MRQPSPTASTTERLPVPLAPDSAQTGGSRSFLRVDSRFSRITLRLSALLILCLLSGQSRPAQKKKQPTQKQDALKSIEGTRGGRHWVNAKTAPPKSPQESLKSLKIEPGFGVQLFAAEPLVFDPVAIAFDERGRMFVVEYGDYPIGPPKKGPPLSRVVMLEDSNGDGRADKRHVFADKLNFAHSLMAFKGGMLVGAQTQILFLKDTDGDHRADVREVLFDGFRPAHPQMQIGCPRWGLDNWVYLNYGPGRITRKAAPGKTLAMPRLDFRFHPLTMEHGPDSGLSQYGNTFDNWGHRFFCTNRNPIMTTALPYAAMRRNPYTVIPKGYYDVGASGGETRVYPLVAMKSNYLSHAGTHTSACGVTAYRGDFRNAQLQRSVFVCEPIGHLVTRSIIEANGVTLSAKRARPKADFLASTDTWFRPASLAIGPDGAIYVADMYRLWVEHPKFLPPDIAKRLDWRAGEDRGRIYKILPQGAKPRRFQPPKTTADLVKLLGDPNGWRRSLGQRLLVERQATEAVPALRTLLANRRRTEQAALARLHALWTLDGLGALQFADIERTLNDSNPFLRRDAVKLAARGLKAHPDRLRRLAKSADDGDIRVRFQLALALGETDDPRATELLARLALRDGRDRWFALAVLTAAKNRSGAILAKLLKNEKFTANGDSARIDLVRRLATVAGSRGDEDELAALLKTVTDSPRSGVWWQTATLSGLARGLPRHRGRLGRTSLSKLVASPTEKLAGPMKRVNRLLEQIAQIAVDQKRSVGDRVAAIPLLAYRPIGRTATAFEKLLASSQPVEVKLACLNAMQAAGGYERLADIVLKRWPELGPSVRRPALTMLLRRSATTRQMLAAMAARRMKPSVLDIDQRVRLLKHRNPQIRKLAAKLFGGAISANRREVAERYRPALTRKGDIAAGFKVFQKSCAKCHKVDGKGYDVGPDISDVRNRSRKALLYDILDPNLKVEPRYTDYVVATSDGRVWNGLMVSETSAAIVLRQPEGKQQVIPRADIVRIRASGKSLMPEGVEKEISIQQMADLLEFLQRPRKSEN